MKSNIAVVVPTCRPDLYMETFLPAWEVLFIEYNVTLLTVFDHEDTSQIYLKQSTDSDGTTFGINNRTFMIGDIMGNNVDLISNRNAGIKNVGFAHIAKNLPDIEYIIALDDDVKPEGDTIADHVNALNSRTPVSWVPVGNVFTRGFPYKLRTEAEVVLSHGVWSGCPDLDAPTQLLRGTKDMNFVKFTVPKGIFYPMCEMNIGFKRKMIPYMYLAPDNPKFGFGRADDIFCGIMSKREIDAQGWAVVTGYAKVFHERASNVWSNLAKEAKFIHLNETWWEGDESGAPEYFKEYHEKYTRWKDFING